MRLRRLFILLLAALSLACGGGGGAGQGGSQAIPGPTGLSASYEASWLQITLRWVRPAGAIQGYNLEAEFENQGFQQVNSGLIDPSSTAIQLTFNVTPPEASTFRFRLQAVNGTEKSEWSNVSSLQMPLLAPSGGMAMFYPGSNAVTVTWTGNSSVASQVRIERAITTSGGGISGPWATLATQSAGIPSYIDSTVHENTRYAYKVTNLSGSASSEPEVISMPVATPLFAPVNLVGTALVQGLQLNWQNVSTAATSITVLRGSGSEQPRTVLATLGPQVQAFTDGTATFGYYTYALRVSDGTHVATSAPVQAAVANPPGALTLSPTVLGGMEGWVGAALRPDGTWALAVNYGPLGIQAAPGLWPQWMSTGAVNWSRNLLQINAQAWPELLYFDFDPQNPGKAVLERVAYDGSSWTKAPLAGSLPTSFAAPPDCTWRLDSSGGVHALVTTYDTSTNYKVPTANYLRASASGATLTPLATLLPGLPAPTASQLFVDGVGTPHLVLAAPGELNDCWPASDGTWAKTAILSGTGVNEIQHFTALSTGADSAWLLATSVPWALGSPRTILAFRRAGGGWQSPQPVYTMQEPNYLACTGMAQAPDGSRMAALIYDSGAGLAVLVYSGTTWVTTLVAPPDTSGMGIGFDASGRLHVLAYDGTARQLVDYHE